jgi:hypothetical protein
LIPIVATYVFTPDLPNVPQIPLWYINAKPPLILGPGWLLRGAFGHAQISYLWSHSHGYLYFYCQLFDGRDIFLAIPEEWQMGWKKRLGRRFRNLTNIMFK